MLNIYGQGKYDTIAEQINELLLGVKVVPLRKLSLRVEYDESRPTFDRDSIYTIFAVDRYREISAAAEYQFTYDYRLNASYAKERYGEGAEADVYDIGLTTRPLKNLNLSVSYEKRNGYTGQLSGLRINGGYDMDKAAIQGGIDYDDFSRADSRSSTAKKYWAGVTYRYNKMVGITTRAEYDVNYTSGDSYQGFVAFNVNY
ncbi:hypothetical protein FO488_05415 [Geobacter sp. FeAm09]|uniref:hypothetical protein n=1 Tax=Geobacter sp. FeAm09 TaxID=2597769 RepID=UPI0011ED841A|nr:hypothetical protein [Geobacter sp. FeAm09]QEM67645.1 hypothetical protein FO488_05415 [Geobacter sp. FeAm09]